MPSATTMGCPFLQSSPFACKKNDRENTYQQAGQSPGVKQSINAEKCSQYQHCGNLNNDLSEQNQGGCRDWFAYGLQERAADHLEAVKENEHQEDPQTLHRKFIVERIGRAKNTDDAHRRKLEQNRSKSHERRR